jgi:hypothetical protein
MGFIPVQLSSVSLNFPYFDKKRFREGILVAKIHTLLTVQHMF